MVLFVGRITRQKGILHLVRAIRYLAPGTQVVLCAGAPDTEAISAEMAALVAEAKRESKATIIWIPEMVSKEDVIALYSHAALFVCPSVYEPFGIINLEAMACETAVVASAVGGIPEVVVDGETGRLVPIEQATDGTGTPLNPEQYVADFAAALNEVVGDPERAAAMGKAGRLRAQESFSWPAIAERTVEVYRSVV